MSDKVVVPKVNCAYIVVSVTAPDLDLVVLGRASIGQVKTEARVYTFCQICEFYVTKFQ